MRRLDYPGIGPEHSFLMDIKRAEYHAVTDQEALDVSADSRCAGHGSACDVELVSCTVLPARATLPSGWPSLVPRFHRPARRVVACVPGARVCLQAFQMLSKLEGIIPALETSHAIAYLSKLCPTLTDERVVINCSGRGDKDVNTVIKLLGM